MARRARRFLISALAALALLPLPARADGVRPVRKDLKVEDLGTPLTRKRMTRAYVYKDPADGTPRLFMSLCANNGLVADPRAAAMGADARIQLLDFNLATGKVYSALGPMGGGVNVHLHSKNGLLYFTTGRPTALCEFDPRSGNVRIIGRMTDHYFDASFNTIEDANGVLYLGTYGGHAVRYDPTTDKLEDLGLMGNQTATYLHTITVKDGLLYCWPWAFGSGGVVVYDLEKKTQVHYFPSNGADTAKAGTCFLADDDEVYFQKEGRSYHFVAGRPIEMEKPPKARPKAIGPRECANVWTPEAAQKALGMEFDLSQVDPNNFNNGAVIIRWRKAGGEWQTLSYDKIELFPNCPAAMDVTPEGKLVGVGGAYGPVFEFDPATRRSRFLGPEPGSIYDILVHGDFIYLSGYSSLLAVYDRTKPYTLSATNRDFGKREINPYITGAAKRATHMTVGADGRLFCGGNHSRHLSGAQVVIFDPKTYQVESLRKEVENYLFRDLAAINGGKQVVIALGNQEKKSVLAVYDAAKRELGAFIELPFAAPHAGNIFPAGGSAVIGLIKLDPLDENGKTVYKSLLYKYDVAAGRLVSQKEVPGKAFNGPSFFDYMSNNRRFATGPDGCGWLFIDFDMTRIHPDGTVEPVLRMDVPGQILFIGDDLYLYNGGRQEWGGFSNILRIRKVFE